MSEAQFVEKIKKKFPHAYSLVPVYMWGWIFRNVKNI
jgi:hypothetical protein